MVKEDWLYLVERLESVGGGLCLDAALMVRDVLDVDVDAMEDPKLEYAACCDVGHLISTAIDHEDFDTEHLPNVRSLEAEMTGRILNYRLLRGWLTKAPGSPSPVDSPSLAEIIGKNHANQS